MKRFLVKARMFEDGRDYIEADDVEVTENGALVFRCGAEGRPILVLAPGQWQAVAQCER